MFTRGTLKSPHELIGMSNWGGVALPQTFAPARDCFQSDQKLLPAQPNFEKNIALALLEAA